MIITIGFAEIEGTVPIHSQFNFENVNATESTLFVRANGAAREKWEREDPFSPFFQLRGVLPTIEQCSHIQDFLQEGGTIISSLVNPEIPIRTRAYQEEIPTGIKKDLSLRDEGCTIVFEYSPYNWLSGGLKHLPNEAYTFKNKSQKSPLSSSVVYSSSLESVSFKVNQNGGKLIFTPLLNFPRAFNTVNDFRNVINKLESVVQYRVASR